MTGRAIIEDARALIEPLAGYIHAPWEASRSRGEVNGGPQGAFPVIDMNQDTYDHATDCVEIDDVEWANLRLIAAAPALRDTIAALADYAEALTAERNALAQRVETLTEALEWYAHQGCLVRVGRECGYQALSHDSGRRAHAALQSEGTP